MRLCVIFSCMLFLACAPDVYAQDTSVPAGEAFYSLTGKLIVELPDEKSYVIRTEKFIYTQHFHHVSVKPAPEHTFFIKTPTGATRILSHNLGWSLIYNPEDQQWYFHRISSDNRVDIQTLRVKKDTPYNPHAYQDTK